MKKICSVMVLIVLMMMVISGCSKKVSNTKTDIEDLKNQKATLTIWNWGMPDQIQAVAESFNEEFPNVKIQIEKTPYKQYWTKLDTTASGNSMPDICWMNAPNFMKYTSNDKLTSLDNFIERDAFEINNYPSSLVDLYNYNDSQYGIPKDYDTIGLWYNKKIFDEAGIPYPDDTWDWEKLREVAQKLTDADKGIYGFAAEKDGQAGYYNFIHQNDGFVISEDMKKSGYDAPETIEALEFLVDLIYKDKVSPSYEQMVETSARDYFLSGKLAMHMNGSWSTKDFLDNEDIDIDVAMLPKGKKRAVIIHGLSYVMPILH